MKGKSKNPVLTQSRKMDVSAGLQDILDLKELFSKGSEEIVLLKGDCKQSEY